MKLTAKERAALWYEKNKEKVKEKARLWKLNNPEKVKESVKRSMKKYRSGLTRLDHKERELKYKYKITYTQYEELYKKQNGVCAICKKALNLISTIDGNLTANVDHNHLTKKVRGLLCNNCNQGLGYFKDNPTNLRLAAEYLDATDG